MKKCFALWFVFCLLVTIVFFAHLTGGFASAASSSEVKVGLLLPLTGPPAAMGIGGKQSLDIYFNWINARGGIKSLGGAKLKMILVDTTAQPDVGVTQAERLISREKVDVLIGCYQSGVTLPVSSVAQRYQVPMISFAGNSDKILQRGNDWIIRPGPWASGTAYARLKAISELNILRRVESNRIGILYIDDEWGQAGNKAITEQAHLFNLDVVISQPYPHGVSDFSSIVGNFKKHEPIAILANAYGPETLLFLRTKYQMDLPGGFFAISGIHDPGFLSSAGETARYLFCNVSSGDWLIPTKSPEVLELWEEYRKKYPASSKEFGGGEGEFFGFQTGQALVAALEEAGSLEKSKIMDALLSLRVEAKELMTPYGIEISSDFLGMKGQNKLGTLPIEQYDAKLKPHMVSPLEKGYDPMWPVPKPSQWK